MTLPIGIRWDEVVAGNDVNAVMTAAGLAGANLYAIGYDPAREQYAFRAAAGGTTGFIPCLGVFGPTSRVVGTVVWDSASGLWSVPDVETITLNTATCVWSGSLRTIGYGDFASDWDPVLQKLVIYGGAIFVNSGGSSPSTYGNHTWAWDGTSWTELFPTGGPPAAVVQPRMAYRTSDSKFLLYGGRASGGTYPKETWQLDTSGPTWTQLTPATTPTPNTFTEVGYYTPGDETVWTEFGASANWSYVSGDWTDDGSHPIPGSGLGGEFRQLPYDPGPEVLLAAYPADTPTAGYDQAFIWQNGWTEITTTSFATGISGPAIVYETYSTKPLMLTGAAFGYPLNDFRLYRGTWLYRSRQQLIRWHS